MMKVDPYNHQEKYLAWKEIVSKKGIVGVSEKNSKIILDFVFDMELAKRVYGYSHFMFYGKPQKSWH